MPEITSNVRLFADDCIIYRKIRNNSDVESIQTDLNNIYNWALKHRMKINGSKSKSIIFCKTREETSLNYEFSGVVIPQEQCCKYLGVYLNSKLSWGEHVDNVTGKAWRALHFIMRILRKANPKSREIAYLTLVRPLMEYGTTCWDPYRIYQINSLERIQYRAAKFVKGKREDGNDTIKELKWETLENRRRKTRITSLYRAHLGQKAWVDITARLEKPTYYGRNDHDFKIKCRKQKTDVEVYSRMAFFHIVCKFFYKQHKNFATPEELMIEEATSVLHQHYQIPKPVFLHKVHQNRQLQLKVPNDTSDDVDHTCEVIIEVIRLPLQHNTNKGVVQDVIRRQECRATTITQGVGEQITILKESIHSHAPNQEKVNAELVAQRMKRIATEHPEIPPVQILRTELTRCNVDLWITLHKHTLTGNTNKRRQDQHQPVLKMAHNRMKHVNQAFSDDDDDDDDDEIYFNLFKAFPSIQRPRPALTAQLMVRVDRDRTITSVIDWKAFPIHEARVDGNSEGGSLVAFASRDTDCESKAAYNIATSYFTRTCNTNGAEENLNDQKTIMTLVVDYCEYDNKQALFPSLTIFLAQFSIPHHMLLQSFLTHWQRCSQHQDGRQHSAQEKELAGSLVVKKLSTERSTGSNGEREKSSGQKKISDGRRHEGNKDRDSKSTKTRTTINTTKNLVKNHNKDKDHDKYHGKDNKDKGKNHERDNKDHGKHHDELNEKDHDKAHNKNHDNDQDMT
ncbi:hypothetical protein ANN_09474 [Periplaneta americana]|uniref:Reverse transcriptase domain-containing protein n=1 Tax=Periplaneta americana TaxID=6978 RepID=A0ABQ8TNZ7_PERAM|nr:hypothetical protein ANN_09474 [Periplaneta americana]